MAVTLYADDGFRGEHAGPFDKDRIDLTEAPKFNDATSSIVVTDSKATFYHDTGFKGAHWTLDPGKYTLNDLQAHGIPNDDISSFTT